jgi:hypothetical protein
MLEVTHVVPEEVLRLLEVLSERCDPSPWKAMVEGRDHESADGFIQVGEDWDRGEDICVTRDSGPADAPFLDLIADARTYLPLLIEEVRVNRGPKP